MKTTLLLLSIVITTETLCAQGTVFFGNNAATIVTNSVTNQKLVAGDTFTVELWYAPDNGSPLPDARLAPIAGARTGIKPIAGFFSGGTVTTPDTTAPGATAYFQIRIWESALGSSWAEAFANGGCAIFGVSAILKVETGNPGAGSPPGSLIQGGLKAFTVDACPEPGTVALGLLAGIAVFFTAVSDAQMRPRTSAAFCQSVSRQDAVQGGLDISRGKTLASSLSRLKPAPGSAGSRWWSGFYSGCRNGFRALRPR